MSLQNKYVSVKTVAARIARNVKGITFDIGDVAEWCFEAIKNIGSYDAFVEHKSVQIPVQNKQATLPCDVYRLLAVRDSANNCVVQSYVNSDNVTLDFSDRNLPSTIEIDYIGFMVDKDGFPMVEDTSQEACFWYCMSRIMLEDYLNGKIDQNRYMFIEEKYAHYVSRAKATMRWTSIDDLTRFTRGTMNIIRSLKYPHNRNTAGVRDI